VLASLAEAAPEPVLPEGEALWDLWLAVATQWRFAGTGAVAGLDYGAVDCAARWSGFEMTAWAFRVLRQMEAAALDVWLKRE
jgi:hypothetical protein